jgi:AcrR family transcriptional regulator
MKSSNGDSGVGGGREQQKQRTRRALVNAARELLRAGEQPNLSEVARAASVSPATAYRHFSSNAELWRAVVDSVRVPEPDEVLAGIEEVEARVDAMVEAFALRRYDDEPLWRTAVASLLEGAPGERHERIPTPTGQRLRWIDAALSPLASKLSAAEYRRLRGGLAIVIGTEAMIGLRDVCGLSRRAAMDSTRFAARALVQAALSGPPRKRR